METAFASEEAKIEALDKIPETPENIAEIQRIMDLPVTPTESVSGDALPTTDKPVETPASDTPPKQDEKPVETSQADAFSIALKDLPESYRNFDNAAKLIKKVVNQDELIERQTQKIRELLQGSGTDTQAQIEQIRRENEELRKQIQAGQAQGGAASGGAQRGAAVSQSKINDIIARRKALLAKFNDPEDQQFNPEFIKERNSLDDMMIEEMVRQNQYLESVSRDVEETKRTASSAIEMRQSDDAKAKEAQIFDNKVKAIQSFVETTDEFKMSKPFLEMDKEYRNYQNSVAAVYFGRQPANAAEVAEAMGKLQQRSPNLLSNLQLAGISADLTEDMHKYLAACEVLDAWEGIRKDPVTGDYNRDPKTGRIIPWTRYDAATRQYVVDSYPSPKAAYNDLLVNSGHYTRKVIDAFKAGGKSLAEARARRDGGVVEMDNASGGKPRISQDAALEDIQKIDEVQATMRARSGDPSLLKRYNDNALILGWPPLEV